MHDFKHAYCTELCAKLYAIAYEMVNNVSLKIMRAVLYKTVHTTGVCAPQPSPRRSATPTDPALPHYATPQ